MGCGRMKTMQIDSVAKHNMLKQSDYCDMHREKSVYLSKWISKNLLYFVCMLRKCHGACVVLLVLKLFIQGGVKLISRHL